MTYIQYSGRILPALLLLAFMTSAVAAAETTAVQTMAGILVKLNHFPSDTEKQDLKKILDDKATTAHERVVAQALLNVQHKVTSEDKPKLEAVIKDKSAPDGVKTLAAVIVGLNHTPSDAEKEKLKKLAS